MKKTLCILLLSVTPACSGLGSALGLDGAPSADSSAAIETAGSVASGGVTVLTGNPALGAAAGALVTGLGAWFVAKRRKPAKAVA